MGVEFLGIEEANGKNRSTSSLILFSNLKSLKFMDMKEWAEWDGMGERREEEEGESDVSVLITIIMPRLQRLRIIDCPKLMALLLETTPLEELGIDCR